MRDVINDFEDRVKEIDLYIDFVEKSHERDAALFLPHKSRENLRINTLNSELTAIFKANIFLILYNLVESSVREGILSVYKDIQTNNHNYKDVRDDIRELWTKFRFKNSFDPASSWDTYYRRVEEITSSVFHGETLVLDRNAIPTSGNLCADKVRTICQSHGIKTTVHRNARGGVSLEGIKDQRNSLAHGHLSFAECGRQFEISQIITFKKETVIFIRGILRNMEEYVNNKEYLQPGAA